MEKVIGHIWQRVLYVLFYIRIRIYISIKPDKHHQNICISLIINNFYKIQELEGLNTPTRCRNLVLDA